MAQPDARDLLPVLVSQRHNNDLTHSLAAILSNIVDLASPAAIALDALKNLGGQPDGLVRSAPDRRRGAQ